MFAYMIGSLEQKTLDGIILEVNGIGYDITVSTNTLSTLPLENEQVKIYTYLQVKEDGICLFGFSSMDEKEMFLRLITVSGVGPKGAMCILSGFTLSDLSLCIINEDVARLSKVKGLGKKTAERVVLELKDKVGFVSGGQSNMFIPDQTTMQKIDEVVSTLMSLGMNKNDAYSLARSHANAENTVEEIIVKCLKGMG